MEQTIWVRSDQNINFATTSEGGPLWPVWSFHCPFPFDKIVVSSTALPHPMPTMQWLGWDQFSWLYHSIRQVKFPKFQSWIFAEWKALTTHMIKMYSSSSWWPLKTPPPPLGGFLSGPLVAPWPPLGGPCRHLHVTFAPRWPDKSYTGLPSIFLRAQSCKKMIPLHQIEC